MLECGWFSIHCWRKATCPFHQADEVVTWREDPTVLRVGFISLPLRHNEPREQQDFSETMKTDSSTVPCVFRDSVKHGKIPTFLFSLLLPLICILKAGGCLKSFIRAETGSSSIGDPFSVDQVCSPWRCTQR